MGFFIRFRVSFHMEGTAIKRNGALCTLLLDTVALLKNINDIDKNGKIV